MLFQYAKNRKVRSVQSDNTVGLCIQRRKAGGSLVQLNPSQNIYSKFSQKLTSNIEQNNILFCFSKLCESIVVYLLALTVLLLSVFYDSIYAISPMVHFSCFLL